MITNPAVMLVNKSSQTYTHTHLMALFLDYPGEPVP